MPTSPIFRGLAWDQTYDFIKSKRMALPTRPTVKKLILKQTIFISLNHNIISDNLLTDLSLVLLCQLKGH